MYPNVATVTLLALLFETGNINVKSEGIRVLQPGKAKFVRWRAAF